MTISMPGSIISRNLSSISFSFIYHTPLTTKLINAFNSKNTNQPVDKTNALIKTDLNKGSCEKKITRLYIPETSKTSSKSAPLPSSTS